MAVAAEIGNQASRLPRSALASFPFSCCQQARTRKRATYRSSEGGPRAFHAAILASSDWSFADYEETLQKMAADLQKTVEIVQGSWQKIVIQQRVKSLSQFSFFVGEAAKKGCG